MIDQNSSSPDETNAPDATPDLRALHTRIIAHLARALEAAAARLARAAAGETVFENDGQAKVALALVNLWPDLLPLLDGASAGGARGALPRGAVTNGARGSAIGAGPNDGSKRLPEDPLTKPLIVPPMGLPPPLIPPCPICQAVWGSHWPDACPQNPDRKYATPTPMPRDEVNKILVRFGRSPEPTP
jgi:hypothetical protein